jgi:hypothetical protein
VRRQSLEYYVSSESGHGSRQRRLVTCCSELQRILARAVKLHEVTACNCPINPITNPNPMCNHYTHANNERS